MQLLNDFGRALVLAAATAVLALAGTANALQFSLPSTDARLHTLTSLEPGAEWNTGALGPANGQLVYTSSTTTLALTAELDVLNYYDPNDTGTTPGVTSTPGTGCTTDVGTNCAYNFATNLHITVDASLNGLVVTNLGSGYFQIDINFETTGGTDITIVDPTDSTTVLSASWQAGTFSGSPTTGLTVTGIYDSNTSTVSGDPTALGFANITGGAYAQLFDSGGSSDVSLHLSEFFDFSPTMDSIAATIIGSNTLPDFTAEGQGQIFRVAAGDFVPEPNLAVMLGSAGLALAGLRQRS
jgi:hypothetical protein